jgi:ketosteroid isomerase-like protein
MPAVMRSALLLLVALVGCGGGGAAPAETTTPEDVEASDAVAEATSLIGEVHASIRRGSPQGILPILAADVFVAAPGGEVFLDKTSAVMALSGVFEGAKHKVKAKGLHVVAAPRGHSAWATEQLDIDGRPYLVTVVLANVDDFWLITAVHVAEPVADKKVKKAVEAGTQPRPPPLTPVEGPGTAELLDAFTAIASGREAMLEALPDRDDVIVVGSAPKEITKGAKKIKKMWKKSLKKSPTVAVVGEVRAQVTPDGMTGWVCAAVDLAIAGGAATPHRAFYLFESDGEAWQLVAAHEAVLKPPSK